MDQVDSDRVSKDIKLVRQLGEIVVMVLRSSKDGAPLKARKSHEYVAAGAPTAPTEVSEKALKGKTLSHGV